MEKRIAALSTEPHWVSLTDRPCSLFIDPTSGSIFVDEGDGEGRINGAVFSPANGPSFAIRTAPGSGWQLVLDYVGTHYPIGLSDDESGLRRWAASANALLRTRGNRVASTLANGPGNGQPGSTAQPAVPSERQA